MLKFRFQLKRLSSQITLTLVSIFSLLVLAGLATAWWSSTTAADTENRDRAASWTAGLDARIEAAQQMLSLTLPIYMGTQGEFLVAAKAALAGNDFDNPKLLPPFNGWNKMLDGRLSRITICDRAYRSVAFVGARNVTSAYPRGGDCAAGEMAAAFRAYLSKPATGKPLKDLIEADGKVYARQYAFIQGMNPDTFENEVMMVLVIDQDLAPVMSEFAKTYGLAEIGARKGSDLPKFARQDERLIVNAPLNGLAGAPAAFVQMQYDMSAQTWSQIMSLLRQALLTGGLLAAAGAFIVFFMHRRVFSPVARLAGLACRLDQFEDAGHVPFAGRGDEIGELAGGLRMAIAARQNEREAQQAADVAKQTTDEERRRNARAARAASEAQSSVVQALASGLDALAHANLTYRLDVPFPAEYEELRSNFNRAMNELQGAIAAVAASAGSIQSRSSEISASANELSRQTEQQAASLEETAAAMTEISGTVSRTAAGTQKASEVVLATKAEAERSGEVVRNAVSAMGGIEASAREISQIIGVIDEIAFQTNLLALNAGVEAARAGGAGRGFAVVASEVRALAQRSAEAAKQIKGLISTSTGQVEKGVSLVTGTGKALEKIIAQVTEISGLVSGIARGAGEQADGVAEVSRVVSDIDRLTQHSAAMAEESNAASHALQDEASGLARLVSGFRYEIVDSDRAGARRRVAA